MFKIEIKLVIGKSVYKIKRETPGTRGENSVQRVNVVHELRVIRTYD